MECLTNSWRRNISKEALYTIWQHNKEPLLNFMEMVSSACCARPRPGPGVGRGAQTRAPRRATPRPGHRTAGLGVHVVT